MTLEVTYVCTLLPVVAGWAYRSPTAALTQEKTVASLLQATVPRTKYMLSKCPDATCLLASVSTTPQRGGCGPHIRGKIRVRELRFWFLFVFFSKLLQPVIGKDSW